MKALKDCEWVVTIHKSVDSLDTFPYDWKGASKEASGTLLESEEYFISTNDAKADFKEFAELNGITNYKFKE